ncbi:MAG: hypothetical protein JXN59_07975 [Anaerolineae bacterium]|nr:hypothetical protein [Anaerolineae bacterium]
MAICGNADLGLSPIVFVQKGPWRIGCAVDDQTAAAQPRDEHTLLIYPGADGSTPQLTGALLRLPPVQRGHLGIVRIIMQQASSGTVQPAGITSRVEAPPPGTRPDATTAAAVDFVLEEAAFYQRRLEGQQVQHDKGGAHEAS